MRFAALLLLIPTVAFADRVAPSAGAPAGEALPQQLQPNVRRPMPPRPMPRPQPSAEVAKQGKLMLGAWTCKGNRSQSDGSSTPFVAKLAIKLDLNNAWIASQWSEGDERLTDYRTFDDTSKQWSRFMLESDGSHQ